MGLRIPTDVPATGHCWALKVDRSRCVVIPYFLSYQKIIEKRFRNFMKLHQIESLILSSKCCENRGPLYETCGTSSEACAINIHPGYSNAKTSNWHKPNKTIGMHVNLSKRRWEFVIKPWLSKKMAVWSWKLPLLVTEATPLPWFFGREQFLKNGLNKVHIFPHQACCNRSKSSAATLALAACPAASNWLCKPHTWRVSVYWACKVSTHEPGWTTRMYTYIYTTLHYNSPRWC